MRLLCSSFKKKGNREHFRALENIFLDSKRKISKEIRTGPDATENLGRIMSKRYLLYLTMTWSKISLTRTV